MKKIHITKKNIAGIICMLAWIMAGLCPAVARADVSEEIYGGGYAASGQIAQVGYTSRIYDAKSGLPTSDAMYILGAADGHVWIGGYSGVIRYDGSIFDRLEVDGGLTSARGIFEDSIGRVWVGTNDNGVVVIDGQDRSWLTYKDGLPTSSIRQFAEDGEGNVYIGTTAGVCFADGDLTLHSVSHKDLNEERIARLIADETGKIYGVTGNGILFSIADGKVSGLYRSEELHLLKATAILTDPDTPGEVYIGTESGVLYHGSFGADAGQMEEIDVSAVGSVRWLNYDCGRIWVSSTSKIGYLTEEDGLVTLDDIAMDTGIEMATSDYQGNLWVASSTMGVMKIVTNNFVDISGDAGLDEEVTNAVYRHKGETYIGTNNGLRLLDKEGNPKENALTEYMEETRIRCVRADGKGNLWVAGYNNDKGLVCYSKDGAITAYTTDNGMPANETRCITFAADGSLLVGTNGGLAILKDGRVKRVIGSKGA